VDNKRLIREAIFGGTSEIITRERFYASWKALVEAYSTRMITRETDKLAALLGFVKQAASFIDDDFMVRLWKKRIHRDLLWWVKEPDKSRSQISQGAR
jgi:hypothetical protein